MNDQWEQWLDEHGTALVLFARQIVSVHADAEEAVQDGFIRFWRIRETADDPVALLFSCVKRAAMDVARRDGRRKRREQNAAIEMPREAQFACPVEQRERREEIELAMAGLPNEQREVMVLKIWGKATFAQIAVALEISPNTAASRYRYALAALRDRLADMK